MSCNSHPILVMVRYQGFGSCVYNMMFVQKCTPKLLVFLLTNGDRVYCAHLRTMIPVHGFPRPLKALTGPNSERRRVVFGHEARDEDSEDSMLKSPSAGA